MQETEQNNNTEMEIEALIEQTPDGKIERRIGSTTYVVNVFFDHDSGFTAEDKIKRLILAGQ